MYKLEHPFIDKFFCHHHSRGQFAEALPVLPTKFPAAQNIGNVVVHALNLHHFNLKFTSGSQ